MSIDEMEGVVQESEDFKTNFALLDRAVTQFDSRFTLRALRSISSLRKKLSETKIASLNVKKPIKELLAEGEKEMAGESKKESVPEVRIYIGILVQVRADVMTTRSFLTCTGLSVGLQALRRGRKVLI